MYTHRFTSHYIYFDVFIPKSTNNILFRRLVKPFLKQRNSQCLQGAYAGNFKADIKILGRSNILRRGIINV